MEYRLTTPCTAQDLAPLRAGDTVLLSHAVLKEAPKGQNISLGKRQKI